MHRPAIGACAAVVACAMLLAGCGKEAEDRAAQAEAEARSLRAERQALTERNKQLESDVAAANAESRKLAAERDKLNARIAAAEAAREPERPQASPTPLKKAEPAAEGGQAEALADARQRLDDLSAALFERGDYNTALPVAQSACDLGSTGPITLFRIAYCRAALGQREQALELYQRAIKALDAEPTPNAELLPKCLNNAGILEVLLGRPQNAEGLYKRALALDDKLTPAYYNLGLLYANDLKRPADAIEAFRAHVIHGGAQSASARDMIVKLRAASPAAASAPE